MATPISAPETSAQSGTSPSRHGVAVATAFGLGSLPGAPGTAGSLVSVGLFAGLQYALEGGVLQFAYLLVLAWLVPLALWSTEHALRRWSGTDPQVIVIDEIVGQWVTYAGLLLPAVLGWSDGLPGGRWKSLLAGFILFRAFDVVKPFPIRRSERVAGAAGVVLDDVLAGAYAALGLLLLAWRGWLR